MYKISRHPKAGFNLIELIVVIAIMGILSSIVYGSFAGARAAARDDARKTDLKNLQLAIEFYKAQNGRYPAGCNATSTPTWSGGTGGTYACSLGQDYIVDLVPDYISKLPRDPRENGNRAYLYWADASGTSYKLLAYLTVEVKRVTSYDDEFARCPRSFGTSWCPDSGPQTSSYAVYEGSNAEGR